MKPLPAQTTSVIKANESPMPSIPSALTNPQGSYSKSNRRATSCPVQRVYPWLLFTSTVVAALFCLMYITKPVIMASQGNLRGDTENFLLPRVRGPATSSPKNASMLPAQDHLPGEKPMGAIPRSSQSAIAVFEQSNLRIQHILTAEAPGGQVARIDLDVPVLYQSRNIRWTPTELAEARSLLTRLSDYQEKSRILRAEGAGLLDSWNHLMERSIPVGVLRADSPTLPTNQQDATDSPLPAGLDTTESIKIQPAGK